MGQPVGQPHERRTVSDRRRWALITLTWVIAAACAVLITVWPAFSNAIGREAFPIGCATGWLACLGWKQRRPAQRKDGQ